jgi:hypothetical protein
MDDLMFDMTAPQNKNSTFKQKASNLKIDANLYLSETGHQKDGWFKEEELMRRKLEKGAIAQLKSRIAQ